MTSEPLSYQHSPLRIWAVSDGRAGIEAQVIGLAEAVARITPAVVESRRLNYAPAFDRLPSALKLWPDAMLSQESDRIAAPYPDIWIAAGRASIPHSLRMRERSGGRTLVVQLQDPKADPRAFDLIIAPRHDGLVAPNALSLTGSTHRVSVQRLKEARANWAERLAHLPSPKVAVLIGGRSKTHDLSVERARTLADQITSAVRAAKGSALVTLSRRTPGEAGAVIKAAFADIPGLVYDGEGENPYFGLLSHADHILVTEDSVNMATEAAATGTPVHILALDRRRDADKFVHFHDSLRQSGAARPFEGGLDTWAYAPLDETARAAAAVVEAFNARYPGRRDFS